MPVGWPIRGWTMTGDVTKLIETPSGQLRVAVEDDLVVASRRSRSLRSGTSGSGDPSGLGVVRDP